MDEYRLTMPTAWPTDCNYTMGPERLRIYPRQNYSFLFNANNDSVIATWCGNFANSCLPVNFTEKNTFFKGSFLKKKFLLCLQQYKKWAREWWRGVNGGGSGWGWGDDRIGFPFEKKFLYSDSLPLLSAFSCANIKAYIHCGSQHWILGKFCKFCKWNKNQKHSIF